MAVMQTAYRDWRIRDSGVRNTDRNSIQVIARAAEVLRRVAYAHEGLSLSELAQETNLARSTIQRIVKALVDEQFLQPASRRGGYVLGSGLVRLSAGPAIDVAQVLQPLLRNLAEEVDETVDLSVLKGNSALFVEHIAGGHRLAALSAVGTEFPLHSTANGKAMLACLSPERRQELVPETLPAFTERTVADWNDLQVQLRQIERSGLAYDLEEHTDGVCAVGTAFLDAQGTPFAVSVPVPRQRFDAKCSAIEGPLLEFRKRAVELIRGSIPRAAA